MAVRFYKELNELSTADFYNENKTKRSKYYEVERIVSRRIRKRKTEYLVKWKGYSSLCSSWEPENNLNELAVRAFYKPNLGKELISAETDSLHIAIQENLASKSALPTVLQFRHDVFNYLFNGKGNSSDGKHIFLEKKDFSRCEMPKEWDQVVDKLGDGVKVSFPVKARLFISQSRKTHSLINGKIEQSPRYYIEKLSIDCMKQPFSLL